MDLVIRPAQIFDLEKIVALLASDPLGSTREDPALPLDTAYIRAFQDIEADCNNILAVGEENGSLVSVLQLTFIPNLTYKGSWRAQIEGVRVSGDRRGSGIGRSMIEWAVERAREKGCRLVQLTTDKSRSGSLDFYHVLGFVSSHEGLKLALD